MNMNKLEILLFKNKFTKISDNFLEYKRTTENNHYKLILINSDQIKIEEYDV